MSDEIEKLIPAEIQMISGCQDKQTSADVSNVASFKLPDPAGKSGGAGTSALLNVLYAEQKAPTNDLSWVEALEGMREILKSQGYDQIPQLTSSRMIDVSEPVSFAPSDSEGTKRAVVVGINYVGQEGELSGCHNDAMNMKEYLIDVHGFKEENMTILLDDGQHIEPTRENILDAYKNLVQSSEPGDVCFCHYSGHGGRLRDENGDEEDGYDETLVPVDYATAGQFEMTIYTKCWLQKCHRA